MDNFYVFNNDSHGVRVPFVSISYGGLSLSEIPPKYFKSLSVSRIGKDLTGTFNMSLVLPFNTFEEGNNDSVVALTVLLNKIKSDKDETNFDFQYGWQNGVTFYIKDATVTDGNVSLSPNNESITYNFSGAVSKICSKYFEKGLYTLNEYLGEELNLTDSQIDYVNGDSSSLIEETNIEVPKVVNGQSSSSYNKSLYCSKYNMLLKYVKDYDALIPIVNPGTVKVNDVSCVVADDGTTYTQVSLSLVDTYYVKKSDINPTPTVGEVTVVDGAPLYSAYPLDEYVRVTEIPSQNQVVDDGKSAMWADTHVVEWREWAFTLSDIQKFPKKTGTFDGETWCELLLPTKKGKGAYWVRRSDITERNAGHYWVTKDKDLFVNVPLTKAQIDALFPEVVEEETHALLSQTAEYQSMENSLNSEMSITRFTPGRTRISDLIETVANYLFSDNFTVYVDHCDREYNVGDDVSSIGVLAESYKNSDGSSLTLQQYLYKLIDSCYEFSPSTSVTYSSKKYEVPVAMINGSPYQLVSYTDGSGTHAISDFGTDCEFSLPFDSYNLTSELYDISYISTVPKPVIPNRPLGGGAVSVLAYTEETSSRPALSSTSIDYVEVSYGGNVYKFKNAVGYDIEEDFAEASGSSGAVYEMFIDQIHSIIKIGPKACDGHEVTFIINNNNNDSEVISFDISSTTLPAIAALDQLDAGTDAAIAVASGLGIASSTDLGGAVALSEDHLETLADNYFSSIATHLSSYISSGKLKVLGSYKTASLIIGSSNIRILPQINGGDTFWSGDYLVNGITDNIDSSGYTTTLDVQFAKSIFNSEVVEKKDILKPGVRPEKSGSTALVGGSSSTLVPPKTMVIMEK